MNALTTIAPDNGAALALPETLAFAEWLDKGRELAATKRHLDWLVGDWIAFGRDHFPEQIDLALADVSDDPRNLKRIEKTARAFPPHLRHTALSFDHHAHLADLPTQEALPLLKRASAEKLTARQIRFEAMERKLAIGQILPREEDHEYDAMLACVRAWNRAPISTREDFAEMVAESHLADIEP